MSLINTAIEADINPVDYLTALIEHEDQIVKEPNNWLPWNYQDNLNNQKADLYRTFLKGLPIEANSGLP